MLDHLKAEVNTNGGQVVINEVIITEPDEERRLAYSLITDYDYLKEKILLFYHSYYHHLQLSHRLSPYYLFLMSGLLDWGKNLLNKGVQELGKAWSPPPEKDMFQLTGELSPDEFKRAGNHLIKICNGWQWKPAGKKELNSKYLKENEQYLLLENALCRRRLNTSLEVEEKKTEDKVIQEGDDEIVVLEGTGLAEQEEKEEDYRRYKMYIIYDEYYHTPRMFFSATQNGNPVTNTDIRLDIQREYLDKTLTMESFPFLEGVVMPTVHPCRHAAVLKTMSDSMSEGGHQIESHFALLIFLKFISSVIPYVEFDTVGDLIFN